MAQIVECIRDDRVEMIHLILMGGRTERRISARTVNVTILSAIIGMVLKYTGHRLIQLATGAFLHDLGMVKVPKEILRKKEKLSRRRAEPDPHAPHPRLPGHLEGAEVPRGHRDHRAAAPRALGRAGVPPTPEGRGHQPLGAHRHRGGRLRGHDQRAARPGLRHRLLRHEDVLSDNGRHFDPARAEGVPREHGHLPDRQHGAAEQLRHRPGDGQPRRRRRCARWWS